MENISVSVRLRSLSKLEEKERCVWKVDGRCVVHVDGDVVRRDADSRRDTDARRSSSYTADHVFGPDSSNEHVYREAVEAMVQDAVEGKNVTIMVYGQTGSGKTHTMGTPMSPGIIQRGLVDIFERIADKEDRDFLLRFSYLEIYNENVTDLLTPEKIPKPLLIKEDRLVGPVVLGLSEEIVTCPEDVLRLLRQGEAKRHVAASKMNERSNRSHTVSRMVLESRHAGSENTATTPVIVSNLVLVDLAGSESVAKTGAEGDRLKESSCINKSLLALGEVVFKLSEGALAAGSHIPYRDSKLTRILKPSLGGNAKTMIICTINPAARHTEESHRTLRFACRAKRVVNNVVVQEVMSEAAAARWQAKALKELQRRRAQGMVASSEDARAQIRALRMELLRSEGARAKATREAEVARQLMTHALDQAAAAAGTGTETAATWSQLQSRPQPHVRTRSWSPSAAAPIAARVIASEWISPGAARAFVSARQAVPSHPLPLPPPSLNTLDAEAASSVIHSPSGCSPSGSSGSQQPDQQQQRDQSQRRDQVDGSSKGPEVRSTAVVAVGESEDGDAGLKVQEATVAEVEAPDTVLTTALQQRTSTPEQPASPSPPSSTTTTSTSATTATATSATTATATTATQQQQTPVTPKTTMSMSQRDQQEASSDPCSRTHHAQLQEALHLWRSENGKIWDEKSQLYQDLPPEVKQELQRLTATIASHEALNAQLQSERDAALQLAEALRGDNTELQRTIAELQRQLHASRTAAADANAAAGGCNGSAANTAVPTNRSIDDPAVVAAAAAAAEANARAAELEVLVMHMQQELEATAAAVEAATVRGRAALAEAQEAVRCGEVEAEELRAQLEAVMDEVDMLRERLQAYEDSAGLCGGLETVPENAELISHRSERSLPGPINSSRFSASVSGTEVAEAEAVAEAMAQLEREMEEFEEEERLCGSGSRGVTYTAAVAADEEERSEQGAPWGSAEREFSISGRGSCREKSGRGSTREKSGRGSTRDNTDRDRDRDNSGRESNGGSNRLGVRRSNRDIIGESQWLTFRDCGNKDTSGRGSSRETLSQHHKGLIVKRCSRDLLRDDVIVKSESPTEGTTAPLVSNNYSSEGEHEDAAAAAAVTQQQVRQSLRRSNLYVNLLAPIAVMPAPDEDDVNAEEEDRCEAGEGGGRELRQHLPQEEEQQEAEEAEEEGASDSPDPGCHSQNWSNINEESSQDPELKELDPDLETALEPVDILQELCVHYAAAAAAAAAAADPAMPDLRVSAEEAHVAASLAAAAARRRVREEIEAVRSSAAAAVKAATAQMAEELAEAQELAVRQDAIIADLQNQLTTTSLEVMTLRQEAQTFHEHQQQIVEQQQLMAREAARPSAPELTTALEAALEAAEVALLKAEARAAQLAEERDALSQKLQLLMAATAAAGAAAAAAVEVGGQMNGDGGDDGDSSEDDGSEVDSDEDAAEVEARRPLLAPSPWGIPARGTRGGRLDVRLSHEGGAAILHSAGDHPMMKIRRMKSRIEEMEGDGDDDNDDGDMEELEEEMVTTVTPLAVAAAVSPPYATGPAGPAIGEGDEEEVVQQEAVLRQVRQELWQVRQELAMVREELTQALEEKLAAEEQATRLRVAFEEGQRRLRRAASETTSLRNEIQMRTAELNNTRRAMEEREAKLVALRATLLVCELPGKELGGGSRGGGGGGGSLPRASSSMSPGACRAASAPAALSAPASRGEGAAAAPMVSGSPPRLSPSLNDTVTAGKEDGAAGAKSCSSGGPVSVIGSGGGGHDSGGGSTGARRSVAMSPPPTELYRRPGGFSARGGSSGAAAMGAANAGNASFITTVAAAGATKGRYDGVGTEEEVTPKEARHGLRSAYKPHKVQQHLQQRRRMTGSRDPSGGGDSRRLGASLVSELLSRLDRLERLQGRSAPPPQQPKLRSSAGSRRLRRLLPPLPRGYACSTWRPRLLPRQQQQQVQLLDVKAQFSSARCGLELIAPSVEKVDAAVSYPPSGETAGTGEKTAVATTAASGPDSAGGGTPVASGAAMYPPMTAQLSITLRKL
ncbi:hypothetical protein Vafri_13867 [Volvox africanus]|uniref:Kinesin motor domain-containing protein n=1 Tax=Volvox africanus TaxID=51714 RepID=A0A8J4BEQ8_9CHLO|nr:hypothetical protein Vafri_13867 [Volvox africanus]